MLKICGYSEYECLEVAVSGVTFVVESILVVEQKVLVERVDRKLTPLW